MDSYDRFVLAVCDRRIQYLRNNQIPSAHAKAETNYGDKNVSFAWNRECGVPHFSGNEYAVYRWVCKTFAEFPNSRLSEMILRHEYSHLRCRDSIVKLICLLAICLHCFNPLTILTFLLYTRFSENIADEAAAEGCSDEERRAYAKALVKLSARTRQVPVVWRNNLLGDKKESMKRRVELIMNRNKKASKIGTVAAVLASVILSGTTVFAYTPMQTVENDSDITIEGAILFVDNNSHENLFSTYDVYFEDTNGEIIPLNTEETDSRAILCSHVFKSGYANQHVKKSNGGCVINHFKAKICTKCNHLVLEELLDTITYAKCTHSY